MENKKHIAILGGGPSGLFMFKRLVESKDQSLIIDIFERKNQLGAGMPYSTEGAGDEHITNVSGNEIPTIVTPLADWIKTVHRDTLLKYNIKQANFNDYKVLPRLLFGQYLNAQFQLLQQQAKDSGIKVNIHYNSEVTNITDYPETEMVEVEINNETNFRYNHVVICTGHNWPVKNETRISRYFDSPYPPAKLHIEANHPVAVKGSSLTAVDAIRTLARYNGTFSKNDAGKVVFERASHSPDFKILLHSRSGMLPAVRFHLEDSHLVNDDLLSRTEIADHIKANDGFLSLDYIFEKDFKDTFSTKDPEFYAYVKDMSLEDFVDSMMKSCENTDPFELLKAEYAEAEKSIRNKESIYWKEMLGVLSFAMNYPAKHLSAEDMQRLKKSLLPLISIVIAYIPQSSCDEMLALHDAKALDIIPVGDDSKVEAEAEKGGATYHYRDNDTEKSVYFETYVDAVGQPHVSYQDFPFKGLTNKQTISPARLRFRSVEAGEAALNKGSDDVELDDNGHYYLKVPGVTINDHFQVVDRYGAFNQRIYLMAVPYMGGYNPDYSGLDFCEEASSTIIKSIYFKHEQPAIAIN